MRISLDEKTPAQLLNTHGFLGNPHNATGYFANNFGAGLANQSNNSPIPQHALGNVLGLGKMPSRP